MSDEKESPEKDEKLVTLQASNESEIDRQSPDEEPVFRQASLESEVDGSLYISVQSFDDPNDCRRKSVKFEEDDAQLTEVIEVEKTDYEVKEEEDETEKKVRLDFIPRRSIVIDDQELLPKVDEGILEAPKSEYQIEEVELKKNTSSMEAYQFVKRYSTAKLGDLGNALVTDAFIYMVIPPDGGYAWIILIVSFIAQAVIDGVIYCLAPITTAMEDDIKLERTETALITSFQTGLYFCSGPIASAAINNFGFRIVGIAGGFLCALGILIASFISNYVGIIICYGLATGCGVGMVWASSQLIIGYYFEKYRPIANGIGSAGSGLGVIVFSIINTNLIGAGLSWRNVLQIHALIMFLVGLSCLAYKPVPPTRVGRIVEQVKDDEDDDDSISNESEEIASAFYSRVMDTEVESAVSKLNIESRSAMNLVSKKPESNCSRFPGCCKCCKRAEKRHSHKRYIIEPSPFDRQDVFFTGVADYSKAEEAQAKDETNIISGQEEKAKQIAYTFSMMHMPSPTKLDTKKKPLMKSRFKRAINLLFDFSLLKMIEFQFLAISAFFYMLGLNIPYLYSAARADIPKADSNALSPTLGVINMIFRILAGYLSMKIKFNVGYLCGGGAAIAGFFVFLSAFCGQSESWFQFLYISMFSAGTACFASLRSIIYVDVLGLEKLTNSFGLTSLIMGIGSFVGSALAGVMVDATGAYMATFSFSGLCLIICGVFKIILPQIMKCKKNRAAKKALNRRVTTKKK